MTQALVPVIFRTDVLQSDCQTVRNLVTATNVFSADEIDIAEELVMDYLNRGRASGYDFIFAEVGDSVVGYTCFGPIAGSENRYEVYWIAVSPEYQKSGLGKQIMLETESAIRTLGGLRIYVETSSKSLYAPTHRFYYHNGFKLSAELKGYYSEQDSKLVLEKDL